MGLSQRLSCDRDGLSLLVGWDEAKEKDLIIVCVIIWLQLKHVSSRE